MAPPRRRTPQPIQHRPVLAALKAKPSGRRGRAGLDRHCARAASKGARRDEETLPAEPRNWTLACPIHAAVLITHSTGKGGLTAAQNNSHILQPADPGAPGRHNSGIGGRLRRNCHSAINEALQP